MFGDLMSRMENQKAAVKEALGNKLFSASDPDGYVTVEADGNRRITNVSIKRIPEEKEQLEDIIVVLMNEVLELAAREEADMTSQMLKDMMPPGFGDLTNFIK